MKFAFCWENQKIIKKTNLTISNGVEISKDAMVVSDGVGITFRPVWECPSEEMILS